MAQFLGPSDRAILDFGCAGGGFGGYLLNNSLVDEVWGIELLEEPANLAKTRLTQVWQGDLLTGQLPLCFREKQFDVIFANDVLEHLVDPDMAITQLRPLLKQGGRFVVSLPNILHWPVIREMLKTRDFRYVDAGVLDRTHLRFFTRKSAIRLLSESGLHVTGTYAISPDTGWKFQLLKRLAPSYFSDFETMQWAFVAIPKI